MRELAAKKKPDEKLPSLPRMIVRSGRIKYGQTFGGDYQALGQLDLAGFLNPDPAQPWQYHFEFNELRSAEQGRMAAMLKGHFDLQTFWVAAELMNLQIDPSRRSLLPRQVRHWWDQFQPSGSFPLIRVDYDKNLGPQAMVQLGGVAMTIPQLAAESYKARMTGVNGSFRFDSKGIYIEQLIGQIEGLNYNIRGQIDGYDPEAPFDLALQTQPFRVPEQPRYLPALPKDVQQIFRMLTPVGWMQASLSARRQGHGGEIQFGGTADILSGRPLLEALARYDPQAAGLDPADPKFVSHGKYFEFPYEVRNCQGKLRFDKQRVVIESLRGDTSEGGNLTITGIVEPPNAQAVVDITIRAENIPFNDELYRAMHEKHRQATLMFFHEQGWRRLHEQGHLITAEEKAAFDQAHPQLKKQIEEVARSDPARAQNLGQELQRLQAKASRPVFELGGRCNAVVYVKGATGEGFSPDLVTELELLSANVVFEHFQYPLKVHRGKLIINKKQARFQDIRAPGLYGGAGGTPGDIDLPSETHGLKTGPPIGLLARGIPINTLLFDVIGQPQARWLSDLRPTGSLDIEGTIFRDVEADRIDTDLDVYLRNGSIAPGRGGYPIDHLNGRITLSLRKAEIEQMAGDHNDASLEITGTADWSDKGKPRVELHATGRAMKFEDPVLDLVQPAAGQNKALDDFWTAHQPAGRFDFTADYRRTMDQAADFRIELRPASLAFRWGDKALDFAQTRGRITVASDAVELDNFETGFDGGRFTLDGRFGFHAPRRGDFTANVFGDRVTDPLLALLPDQLASFLRAVQLKGPFELNISTLKLYPDATAGNSSELAATLNLTNTSATIRVPIRDLIGTMTFAMVQPVGSDRMAVQGRLTAERFYSADRLITDAVIEFNNPAASSTLQITRMRGRCADGVLAGQGNLSLDRGDFQFRLALSNAKLSELLVHQGRGGEAADPRPDPSAPGSVGGAGTSAPRPVSLPPSTAALMQGTLSASLDLQGSWVHPGRLQGRGDLLVRRGSLQGVPIATGLLRISYLLLPTAVPFDSAMLSYYMRHDRMVFERIELISPRMKLSGTGTMTLPQTQLDLALTTSNPGDLKLGAFSELLDKLRNQLATIRVTGTLDKPQIKVQQFYGVEEAIEDVLGDEKKKPKKKEE